MLSLNKNKTKKERGLVTATGLIILMISVNLGILYTLDPSAKNNLTNECPPLTTLTKPYLSVFEDLGIEPNTEVIPDSYYEVLGKLRDNNNDYMQVWTPWVSRGALHIAKVSDDGEFLVVGGGYLLDTELHIYRWNTIEREYIKVWEVGAGIITQDVYDVTFGDCDNNDLIEIAAASADGRIYLFEQAHISDPIANLENRFDFVWRSDRFFQATAVEFEDMDLDGVQDLVVGSWDNKIHIFEYTSHSGYPFSVEHWIELTEKWTSAELDDKIQSLGVGDINNNGLPDFVVGTISGSVYVFENDGVILSPHGIEFPFPNDDDYRQVWTNAGVYQPIWKTIGQIAMGELDDYEGTDAVILAWGQGAWILRYSNSRGFFLEQLTQAFESWQMQGAYPLDNFADWMVRSEELNNQVYFKHPNGTKYPEPWGFDAQNEFDIFANSAATGEPFNSLPPPPYHGGTMFGKNEYKLFQGTDFTWFEAKAACEEMGGHLVTITSSQENEFVISLMGLSGFYAWIGLTDEVSEGVNQWITGEDYSNSIPSDVRHLGYANPTYDYYAMMYDPTNTEGLWLDAYYYWTGADYYICEWEIEPLYTPTPHGGVNFEGNEYKCFDTKLNWFQAKASCEALGGHLVTITSAAEESFVQTLLGTAWAWIGLTDQAIDTVNRWVTGEPYSYHPVIQNEGPSQNYFVLDPVSYAGSGGWWRDAPYTNLYYFICEWENNRGGGYYNGHQYSLVAEQMTWLDAQLACEALGGHLATIADADEESFVQTITESNSVWIGLTDEGDENNFRWVTGEPVTYTNWATNEPNNAGGGEHYTEMLGPATSIWNDLSSSSTRYFICEWESNYDETKYDLTHDSISTTFYTRNTPLIQYPSPQHDGTMFNNHEYKFYQTTIYNWTEAQAACEALGGHLVTITSSEENDFVSSLTLGWDPYIGFTDINTEGEWHWITGENNSYTNWMSGQPNGGINENYSIMYDIGTWGDSSGSYTYGYICEWDYDISVINYLPNATGTWNLGKGEELASNGNEEPDLYIIFKPGETVDPSEWVISLSNNLNNWYPINTTNIRSTSIGLAIDVDPLFAVKKMMSAQYVQLTLLQENTTTPKERSINAIVHPNVARPITIGTSVTIEPLSFEYNEDNPTEKIIFGGTDGRIIVFKSQSTNISYYKKFSNKPAELVEIPAEIFGLKMPSFKQIWDSYTDDFWNLGETIWSIQSSPKQTVIPSWRYEESISSEFSLSAAHHITATDITGGSDYELVITKPAITQPKLSIYSQEGIYQAAETSTILSEVNDYPDYFFKILTSVFADIDSTTPGNELIVFPWNQIFSNPEQTDLSLMPSIWRLSGGVYGSPEVLWDADRNLYNFLMFSTTYPSATAVDLDNDTDIDLVLSNGKLAVLWNIGSPDYPSWKLDIDYFAKLNENAPPAPIFSPNIWDYDQDGDYDLAYSYGRISRVVNYNGHEYAVFTDDVSWAEAKAACEKMGGHLVTISDANENNFVYSLFRSAGIITRGWIGLTDNEAFGGVEFGNSNGEGFVWVTGEPVAFTNWVINEPNNGGSGEDYGEIYTDTGDYQTGWNDRSAASLLPYVCEWEPENLDVRYGMDFFENVKDLETPEWERNAFVMKNPTKEGSLRFNTYTAGVIIPSISSNSSADSLWAYNAGQEHVRQFLADTDSQTSLIIGTNPELMKLEVNLAHSPPNAINFGYSTLKSWSNLKELEEWTLTLTTSLNLDGDNNSEIIVSDWDNNVYIFEHLAENTYKRAWKSQDLNHTIETNFSPYAFQDLPGVSGEFQKTIYDHGNLLMTGLDSDKDGNEEFLVTAALTVYVFEATGYNDEYKLMFEKDYQYYNSSSQQFTAIAVTPDFDQRGPMIALAAGEQLFLLRGDSESGWVESFQSLTGEAYSGVPGTSSGDFVTDLPIHGGYMFDGNEYKHFQTMIYNWTEAQAACEALGGHLVTITSSRENTFVSTLTNGWDPYIGFTDIASEGDWQWVTGEDNSYTNWHSGEPNGGTGQNYARLYDIGDFADTDGSGLYGYICEWERKMSLSLEIHTLLFADMNQDGNTELWLGGVNNTMWGKKGFLLSLDSNYGDVHSVYNFPAISTGINTLESVDANYNGNLEFIIAHEEGLDIWEISNKSSFSFSLLTFISSDPNYGQSSEVTPCFDTIQSPIELAPRSNDIIHLTNDNYFSVYGLEDVNHDILTNFETQFQNLSTGEGNLYYNVSSDPQNLGVIQDQAQRLTNWPIIISEVYYEDSSNPGDLNYQWVELYNPNPFIVELTAYSLDTSITSTSLSSNIQANGYFIIYTDLTTYNSKWVDHPANLQAGLSLTTNDFVRLRYGNQEIDYISWGNGAFWDLSANGTSLERLQINGYLENIVPKDTNSFIDWINTTSDGDPGFGVFSPSLVNQGYEYRPVVTQSDTGTITVAWIVSYLSSWGNYTRAIYIKQFDEVGNSITPQFPIEYRTNTLGATADTNYHVRYEDLSILDIGNGQLLLTYVVNDNSTAKLSCFSGNVTAKVVNTSDWTISDVSSNLGVDHNFKISSLALVKIQNRVGIVFSGLSRKVFDSYHKIYVSYFNSSFHNQGISSILSGKGNYQFPDISVQSDNPNYISLVCEHTLGGKHGIISIFSGNGGNTWSDQYNIRSDDPYLHQETFGLFTDNYASVTQRNVFRPRITSDNTGGIFYQFSTSLLLRINTDISYTGDQITYDYDPYTLVTQLWTVNLISGSWFKYNGISNVRDIAIGDSDNDLRLEIFISHDYSVTLLEISQDISGIVSYVQKWQYESPLFISAYPEQLNGTGVWLEYANSQGNNFRRETGGVAIADTNGNGWPELIFTVHGGDAFSFELKDLEQPMNDDYFITEFQNSQNIDFSSNASDLLITEVMYDPDNPNEEAIWIEIYNPTDSAIVLNSYTISNLITSYPLAGLILANNYYLAVKNETFFSSLYPTVPVDVDIHEIPALNLNNLGDQLNLNYVSTLIDSLSWGSESPNYELNAHNTTLRRLAVHDTDSNTDWEDSNTFGIPGSDPFYFASPQIVEDILIDLNNDGTLDHLVADSVNGKGIIAWDAEHLNDLWVKPIPGEIVSLYHLPDGIIIVISTKGVISLNLDGSERFWIASTSPNPLNSHLFVDINSDGENELILATDSDVRAIQTNVTNSASAIIWSNSDIDSQSSGYFDISEYQFGDSTFLGISSSDFSSYRRINILDKDGLVLNSFLLAESGSESNLTNLIKFDANSKSFLDDFDGNGQIDILIAIFDNYNDVNPQSRIEVWNTETLNVIMNLTLPTVPGIDLRSFQMLSYDVNNDSLNDIIFAIPQFEVSQVTGNFGGIFALDIAGQGKIIWNRFFTETVTKFTETSILPNGTDILVAFSNNSGIFSLTKQGRDLFWVSGNSNSTVLNIYLEETTKIWTTFSNGTIDTHHVTGILSPAINEIIELPNLLKLTKMLYHGNPIVLPVQVSNDETEKLLIAYRNGTLILRTLAKELWRANIDPFSEISATGLILDKQANHFALAFKTDTGNLMISDRTSTTILNSRTTKAEIITNVDFGINTNYLLMHESKSTNSILSLYDPISGNFIWTHTNPTKLVSFDTIAIDPSLPGVNTHVLVIDIDGIAQIIKLPVSIIDGGILPDPSSGEKWLLAETLENSDQLSEVFLLSDKSQVTHYSWSLSGLSVFTNDLPEMTVSGWNVVEGSSYDILLSTEQNGIVIYQEDPTGNINNETVSTENNYYTGCSDNQLLDFDNSGNKELVMAVGSTLVVKDTVSDTVRNIYSLPNMVKSLKTSYIDTTNIPIIVVILTDGSVAIVDPLNRIINIGIAEITTDFDYIIQLPASNPIDDLINNSNLSNNDFTGIFIFILFIVLFVSIIRRKKLQKVYSRRFES